MFSRVAESLTDLFSAVKSGQLIQVKRIIQNDITPQAFKNLSPTLIHQASNNEHSHVLKYLLDHGAYIDCMDANKSTALHVAARKGDIDSLIILIEYGADINAKDYDNRTPLYFAAYDGHSDCLSTILQHEKVDISITRNGGWSSLHETARFGHIESTKLLISCGMDIMARTTEAKWTPGHMAASSGRLECLKLLIEAGIDINVGAGGFNHSSTLLHEACHNGHDDCIELLLQSGADPSLYDGPDLPHHLACKYGHASSLDIMLSHFTRSNQSYLIDAFTNVDPETEGSYYYNALHMASFYGKKDCLQVLLKHNAKNVPNGAGRTPEILAAAKLQIDCLKLLLADLRNKNGMVSLRRSGGMNNMFNPLYYLCMKSYRPSDKTVACACLLLNSGLTDINMRFDDQTCLEICVRHGAIDLVRFLLTSGAEANSCKYMEERIRNNPNVQMCVDLVEDAKTEPKSLLLCCRLKVRECLISKGMEGIYELPLYRQLKHYVYHGHSRFNILCNI